jgi:hypothetical protein
MAERKRSTEERTPLRHIAAFLEQAREVARAAGVNITTHTIDTPAHVASASIGKLRADPMLWAAYNRGWVDHTQMVRDQVTMPPPAAASTFEGMPPHRMEQTASRGANPHPETTEWTGLEALRRQQARGGRLRDPRP